jgi:hypothetical protein
MLRGLRSVHRAGLQRLGIVIISRIRFRPPASIALPPKIPAAFSSNWVFHAVTWVAWTSWCTAISATVFSPLSIIPVSR